MAALVTKHSVNDYLSKKQKESNKDLAKEWAELEDLHNKKLWHQLTLKLLTLTKNPNLQKGDNLIQLYNNFISTFENKINPFSLVEIAENVVQQFKNKKDAVAFLQKIEDKVKDNMNAVNLCKVLQGQILLTNLNDLPATKNIIVEVEKSLDDANRITPVHGEFYLLASQYYKVRGDHAQYYRAALHYLGCIELEELTEAVKQEHAYYLTLAALLGEDIFNLGELLAHPILEFLKAKNTAWLIDLLYAFNSGDISKFETMKPKWKAVPDLLAQEGFLRQKISLLCLMEMTFKNLSNSRQLSFEEIARETRLPPNSVEHLLMKAFSLGLVRGSIDQVSETVNMTWVQPRVLDKTQISQMVLRLDSWNKQVNIMGELLESKASEILTL